MMTTTDWIQAVSMIVLAVITAIYAWRTHVISKATKDQADALKDTVSMSVRPFIVFEKMIFKNRKGGPLFKSFGPPGEIYLTAVNVGKGPAFNITITCECQDKKVEYDKKELPFLAVNDDQSYSLFMKSTHEREERRAAYLLLKAKYFDELGECWEVTQQIDKNENWEEGEIRVEKC